jgi:hypothetical protein
MRCDAPLITVILAGATIPYTWHLAPANLYLSKRISYKKQQWRPPSKKKKRGKNLSPRSGKACHSVSTALQLTSIFTNLMTVIFVLC